MLIRKSRTIRLAVCLALGSVAALAQTQYAYVSSSYPMASATVGGTKYSVTLSVTYPSNLSASSYVLGTQLATDVAGFFAGYPNPSDPPEAIGSSVLTSLLGKYTQMTGGALGMSVPPAINTTTGQVTLGATIEVLIGTISIGGLIASHDPVPQSTKIVKPLIRPVVPQDPKVSN